MGFKLIQDDIYYKKVITFNGEWVKGVYVKNETITYEEVEGNIDPYNKGASAFVLPEGVGSSDSYVFYTDEELKTHKSLQSGSNLADIVYLTDPEEDTSSEEYTVFEKRKWPKNSGFMLIDDNHNEYLLIREALV